MDSVHTEYEATAVSGKYQGSYGEDTILSTEIGSNSLISSLRVQLTNYTSQFNTQQTHLLHGDYMYTPNMNLLR